MKFTSILISLAASASASASPSFLRGSDEQMKRDLTQNNIIVKPDQFVPDQANAPDLVANFVAGGDKDNKPSVPAAAATKGQINGAGGSGDGGGGPPCKSCTDD